MPVPGERQCGAYLDILVDLILRRAQNHRPGNWPPEDYDGVEGERTVGRMYQVNDYPGQERWFWGLGFKAQLDGKKRDGHVESRDAAMIAFKEVYARRVEEHPDGPASDQRPETENLAEMSTADLVAAIEHAGFACEGGGLAMFAPWQELRDLLASFRVRVRVRNTRREHDIVSLGSLG